MRFYLNFPLVAGYVLMATPGLSLGFTLSALFIIAFGNGLFKGNLQAIVGQMYDDEKDQKKPIHLLDHLC